ncbi:MAG TPA: glycosyltransferase [Solirubrobacteraceae bacterium]|nr:glycosyltransferase [Solirubrobacteraceae bacterium]
MEMTRVLLVHQPTDGGVGRHVADVAVGLRELGYEVLTCGPARPVGIPADHDHVPLELRRTVSGRDVAMVARFARIVRHVRPDLVHAHSSKAGAVARLARLREPRIPVVYTPHGFAFAGHFRFRAERLAYREAERALGHLTDRVVCVCHAEARLAGLVVASRRVRVVHNGVPPAPDGPPHAATARLTRIGPVVCTLGLMRAGKGVETLIDAAPGVLARHPDAQFAIWGDGPETATLLERARQNGVERATHFLGPTTDPMAALRGVTVFVMPSWRESFPYVTLEAMSAGLPVVSTDVGGVREAIVDGRHGLLVPPGDAHALARAVAGMLDDADQRERLGRAARRRVEEEFTERSMLTGLNEVYTEIVRFIRF